MNTGKQEKRRVVLIGGPSSKRAVFFQKAAGRLGVPVHTVDWEDFTEEFDLGKLQGAAVKIDPPAYQTVQLCQMQRELKAYHSKLQRLSQADCHFLNPPEAIWQMLDKRGGEAAPFGAWGFVNGDVPRRNHLDSTVRNSYGRKALLQRFCEAKVFFWRGRGVGFPFASKVWQQETL